MERVPSSFESASRLRVELGDSLARFERMLARPTGTSDWAAELSRSLVDLRTAFAAHVAEVEHEDGLLADLRTEAPRVSNRVALLEQDHVEIGRIFDVVGGLVDRSEPDEVREQALDLMRRIVVHRQRGADLAFEAYVAEIGGQSG
jgi:hypothetical protein